MAYQPIKFAGSGSPFGNAGRTSVRNPRTGAMMSQATRPAVNPIRRLFPVKPSSDVAPGAGVGAVRGVRDPGGSMAPQIMPNQGGSIDQVAQMLTGGANDVQTNPAPAVAPSAGMSAGVQDLLRRIMAMRGTGV